jgi:putative aminopeptidase FrvX
VVEEESLGFEDLSARSTFSDLWIDVGAEREDAKGYKIGDPILSQFSKLPRNHHGAIDNRAGCAILIDLAGE